MNPDSALSTPAIGAALEAALPVPHRLQEQFANLEQQHEVASLGMWIFLATEVMFFGTLFLGLGVYHSMYPDAFETASTKLNRPIGAINTVVLLVSSLTVVLAVHYTRLGEGRRVMMFLGVTALLGVCFLCLKGLEYYLDYRENLIPGWRFEDKEWIAAGLGAEDIPHVKLFLLFYWIMTGFHALHVTIGIAVVTAMVILARQGRFSPGYYSPVDVTALYWHFVDIVWIFLLPMLYLLGGA
jgi:cytochrome c oxidase subunit 3